MSFAIISIHYPTVYIWCMSSPLAVPLQMRCPFLLIPVAGCVGCTVTTTITTANTDRVRPSSVLTGSVITASTAVTGTVVSADLGSVAHDVRGVTVHLPERAVSSPSWRVELVGWRWLPHWLPLEGPRSSSILLLVLATFTALVAPS